MPDRGQEVGILRNGPEGGEWVGEPEAVDRMGEDRVTVSGEEAVLAGHQVMSRLEPSSTCPAAGGTDIGGAEGGQGGEGGAAVAEELAVENGGQSGRRRRGSVLGGPVRGWRREGEGRRHSGRPRSTGHAAAT